jgi:primary-amine oxidase
MTTFLSFRLDLDVGTASNNSLMVDKLVPYKLPDSVPGRHWIWAMKTGDGEDRG